MSMLAAFISGCAGETLSDAEWRFFEDARPAGLILFQRNIRTPEQVKALIARYHDAVGRDDLLVLVDQEGGRVQRLKPPHWRQLPSAAAFGVRYASDPDGAVAAARAVSQLAARELAALGFTVNCVPVLDLPVPGAHQVIGDRAYGHDIERVVALGRAVCEGTMAGGMLPVIKHIPGHGRANQDSHLTLPVIEDSLETLRATDFAPFKALAGMPLGMTAHVLITALDQSETASTSPLIVDEIIRGEIGFDGLLMCDDLSMKALRGSTGDKARRAIAAGCDIVLHCNGDMAEMVDVAANVPELEGEAERRFLAALARRKPSPAFDATAALAQLDEINALGATLTARA
ncbi:MAG: beta-N-acetylhexosaminidase [Hyphomicrobiaceae bacterium]